MPLILAFIAQDNLEFTKNSDRIKVGSLKKMSTLCKLKEFYGESQTALKYMKTSFLADFLISGASCKDEEHGNLPLFLKNRIKEYMEFTDSKTLRCRELLNHVKRKKAEFDSDEDEKNIRHSLQTMLTLLPEGEWVSVYNIAKAVFYRELEINPFSHPSECHLQLDMAPPKDTSSRLPASLRQNSRVLLSHVNELDAISIPLMKALLFFFGSLNIVALGYSDPENDVYHHPDKPWLTIFDGLQYVRLTDFGAFVLGKKESFAAFLSVEKQPADIIIDENRTMLSIFGEDPVKRLLLESVGKRINKSSYMVDYKSFLKDCSNNHDVENRIDYFRTHISKSPPEIWEIFFKSVLARMQPLEMVKDMHVFKVKPDRELISLLTTDAVLKKYVIRAENYHLLVKKQHYSTVKKRLAQLGFF